MNIKRLLELHKQLGDDKDTLMMILSNRITHYLGDKCGAAISIKKFDILVDDILKFIEFRENNYKPKEPNELRTRRNKKNKPKNQHI